MIPLRVEDTVGLEDFGDDRDSGVDRVRNHKDESVGAVQGDSGSEIADDASIDLASKQISTGYEERWIDKP